VTHITFCHISALQAVLNVTSNSTTYLVTRTWSSAADAGNNSVSQSQNITVVSNTPPYRGIRTTPGCNNTCNTTGVFMKLACHAVTQTWECTTLLYIVSGNTNRRWFLLMSLNF
jgi:hypothetical protein